MRRWDLASEVANSDDYESRSSHGDEHSSLLNGSFEPGVSNSGAGTIQWNRSAFLLAYALMWFTFFVEGILTGSTIILTPYIASTFAMHSFMPTINILSSVIGGVTNLTLAKVLDVFGRSRGYSFCILLATLGLLLTSACQNMKTFAAAQVLQTLGNTGIQYTLTVLVADTTSLRNRGLVQSIVSSPNILTVWLAGPIASAFLNGIGWRWVFVACAGFVLLTTLPLLHLLVQSHKQAAQQGLASHIKITEHKTCKVQLYRVMQQFDLVGLVLLSAGIGLILLALNLSPLQEWNSPQALGMLFLGGLSLVAFIVWEKRFADEPFMPSSIFLDRTALGACILSSTLFLSYWSWNSFFSSYLQVVHGLGVSNANNVLQSYTVCSVLAALVIGVLIHRTGHFKYICLSLGVLLSALGSASMLYVCVHHESIWYIVLCQIIISVGAGTVMVCTEVAILAAAGSHHRAAVCLAVLGMFSNIGGALSSTISSMLWQTIFPVRLRAYLPPDKIDHLPQIVADLSVQLSYPVGSEIRAAIQEAYVESQGKMLEFSTRVWMVGFVAVMVWRNINIDNLKN